MNTKPILMSGTMVRTILDGRKTQTRRTRGLDEINESPGAWELHRLGTLDYMTRKASKGRFGAYFHSEQMEPGTLSVAPVPCPYGRPGDLLWVRETSWIGRRRNPARSPYPPSVCYLDSPVQPKPGPESDPLCWHTLYWRKTPSIHMPRWASRITLRITDVRVERVQEITADGAVAEGITTEVFAGLNAPLDLLNQFQELWGSLNAARGFSWSANPWVWVIEFEPIMANVDDVLREAA